MTICTESKTDRNKFNLTHVIEMLEHNKTLLKEDAEGLQALYQICDLTPSDDIALTSVNYVKKLLEINHDFLELSEIAQIGVTNFQPLNTIFQEIVTGEGICYTTNMLDYHDFYTKDIVQSLRYPKHDNRSDWTVAGYPNNDPNLYPGNFF